MSFSVLVRPPGEQTLPPDDDSLFEEWLEEQRRDWLYYEPLAADGTYFDHWYAPAVRLSLPFLSQVYQDGLQLKEAVQLRELMSEVEEIERFWITMDIDPTNRSTLMERARYLREGIQIALEKGAWLSIS